MREWKQAREQYRFAEFKRLRQMSKKQQQKLEIDSVTYLHSSNRSPSFMYSFANPLLYSRFSGLARGAQGDKVYFVKGRTNLREDRGLDIIGTVAAASERQKRQSSSQGTSTNTHQDKGKKTCIHFLLLPPLSCWKKSGLSSLNTA